MIHSLFIDSCACAPDIRYLKRSSCPTARDSVTRSGRHVGTVRHYYHGMNTFPEDINDVVLTIPVNLSWSVPAICEHMENYFIAFVTVFTHDWTSWFLSPCWTREVYKRKVRDNCESNNAGSHDVYVRILPRRNACIRASACGVKVRDKQGGSSVLFTWPSVSLGQVQCHVS